MELCTAPLTDCGWSPGLAEMRSSGFIMSIHFHVLTSLGDTRSGAKVSPYDTGRFAPFCWWFLLTSFAVLLFKMYVQDIICNGRVGPQKVLSSMQELKTNKTKSFKALEFSWIQSSPLYSRGERHLRNDQLHQLIYSVNYF